MKQYYTSFNSPHPEMYWVNKTGVKKLFWKLAFRFGLAQTKIFQRIYWYIGKQWNENI